MEVIFVIGDKIRELRKAHGLTQAELAQRISITQSAVAKYESGTAFPGDDVKLMLSKLFSVSMDYLMDRPTSADIPTQRESELLDAFRRLNDAGQAAALAAVKGLMQVDGFIKTPADLAI